MRPGQLRGVQHDQQRKVDADHGWGRSVPLLHNATEDVEQIVLCGSRFVLEGRVIRIDLGRGQEAVLRPG